MDPEEEIEEPTSSENSTEEDDLQDALEETDEYGNPIGTEYDDDGNPIEADEIEAEPEAEQPEAEPVTLPDIPGASAISESDIESLAPLIDPTSPHFNPGEYTRRLMALTRNQVAQEFQANASARQQQARLLGGRRAVLEEYGTAIDRVLATMPVDRRHTKEATLSATVYAFGEEFVQGDPDKAIEKFYRIWTRKSVPATPRAAQPKTQKTPAGSGSNATPARPLASNPIKHIMKTYNVSESDARQILRGGNGR